MAGLFGGGSNQPVIQVLVDSYTPSLSHQIDFLGHASELHRSCCEAKGKCPELKILVPEMESQEFPQPLVYGDVELASPKSSDVTHSPFCKEIRIVSGVSILNVFTAKNLFRALRSKIGCHFYLVLVL